MIRNQELAGLARTLGRDHQLKITIGGKNSYCSADGQRIHIARMPATPLGRLLMTGLVYHEVAHKNYTQGNNSSGLLGEMTNVLEDIRVEGCLMKDRPGTGYDLERVTDYYVEKGSLSPQDIPGAFLGLVMAYGRGIVLKQKGILALLDPCRKKLAGNFGKAFPGDVETLLEQRLSALRTTEDSRKLAKKLIELLRKQSSPSEKNSKANGAEAEQKETGPNSGQGDSQDTDKAPEKGESGKGKGSSLETSEGKGTPDKEGGASQDPATEDDSSPESATDTEKPSDGSPTANDVEEMITQGSGGYGDLSRMIVEELDQLAAQTSEEELSVIPELPEVGRILPGRDTQGLDETGAVAASSRMRSRLMTLIQGVKRKPIAYGSSGRRLSPHRLIRMACGDPRIFQKKLEVPALNTAVVVLVDASGSMFSQAGTNLRCCDIANASAFALHHTLYGLSGVKVATAEFSGREPSRPEVNLLADFGEKPDSIAFSLRPGGCTPTAPALWFARAALLQRPEPRRIILVVTDGCPDNPSGTLQATHRILLDKIEIAAIGIRTDEVGKFWERHRVIHQVEDLPKAMFDIMEGMLVMP